MKSTILDFDLSDDQLEALNFYILFRQNDCLRDIARHLTEEVERITIAFNVEYNDYTHDVRPILADLIVGNSSIKTVVLDGGPEFEIKDFDGSDGMQTITITPKMLTQ